MRLNPERLLVLRAVADAGGVVAAGRRLHLASSGISQHIAALERETGLVILDRSRRGGQRPAQLTAAGRLLLMHATRLAEVLADAEADVRALAGQVDGPVVLAAFPTVIARLAVPALTALTKTHPGITPVVRESSLSKRTWPGLDHPSPDARADGCSTTVTESPCPPRGRCRPVSSTLPTVRGSTAHRGQQSARLSNGCAPTQLSPSRVHIPAWSFRPPWPW
jgi:DNA-binding transcriptional LysR family regulator